MVSSEQRPGWSEGGGPAPCGEGCLGSLTSVETAEWGEWVESNGQIS